VVRTVRFRQLSHTADLRLAAWGTDEAELVGNAVLGTMHVVLGRDLHATPRDVAAVSPWPTNLSSRLVRATNEALFWLYGHRLVTVGVRIDEAGAELLVAPLPSRWPLELEIKAVTYHDLRPARAAGRWRAILTLDI
jgi:SHS2 domain-containing protein